jgi:hypothetical protein
VDSGQKRRNDAVVSDSFSDNRPGFELETWNLKPET